MRKELPGIGPVIFKKYKRSRNINLHVSPFNEIKVTIPLWVSYEEAETLVFSKKEWILRQSEKMGKWKEENAFSPDLPFDVDDDKIKSWLTERTRELAGSHGFSFRRISIRNQRTRWGSCSPVNNINLNRKLAWIPDELVDYVILHELVHTKIKNHGKEFWKELEGLLGNAKALDRRLRDYHLELL